MQQCLRNVYADQAKKLKEIPVALNEIFEYAQSPDEITNPVNIEKDLTFELPKGWAEKLVRAVEQAHRDG